MNGSKISAEELEKCKNIISVLSNYYDVRIVGQSHLKEALLVSLMTNSHILLESVPGLAKTTAAKVLTSALNGKFVKIQCTPDLLPSDIIGTQIFNYSNNTFETVIGPVCSNFVLLDEINRSSAKTQSAMLEVMQERQVSIAGQTYKMPDVFVVMATQNPIEQEGTYLLAEAQLDRFLLKEVIGYPTKEEEIEILRRLENKVFENNNPVLNITDLQFLQTVCEKVFVDESIKTYITNIIDATRHTDKFINKDLAKYVEMGSSPRGSIALMQVSKAVALIKGRNYVTPDDVKELIYCVLRHRIMLNYSAVADNVSPEKIITAILGAINTP